MRIRSWFLMSLTAASIVGGSVMGARTNARAAEVSDEFPHPGDPTYFGIPDLDTHSGFFLDVINSGSQSLTSELNPSFFVVTFPPAAASEKIYIFDGNNAGLWDQKQQNHNFSDPTGTPPGTLNPVAPPLDHCLTHFDVFSMGAGGPSATPIFRGESEDTPAPAIPQSADYIFHNSDDSKWELFLDATTLSPAQRAAALLPSGEHRFYVKIQMPDVVLSAINGYKIAANGNIRMASDPTNPANHTWLGGFIGGVVDLQWSIDVPTKPDTRYLFSRDHYPTDLKPGLAGQHMPYGGPADPYVNNYAGQMDFHVHVEPPPGISTEEYVLTQLQLENGDFDDRLDLTEPDKVTGLPGPHPIGYPDSHGLPADQGGKYTDLELFEFDTSGLALPLPPFPPGPIVPGFGAPYLEVYAPGIVPDPSGSNATLVVHDLSGNVPPVGNSGFEAIPIPITSLPLSQRVPGTWTLRFKNVDARNSVFIRSNAEFATQGCFKGRVFCDANKDGDDELGLDAGIPSVNVKLTRTDVVPNVVSTVQTDATGTWEATAGLLPGTYDIEVDNTQPALAGKPNTTPLKFTRTIHAFDCVFLNFGFDCSTCECTGGRMMKKVCLTTELWVSNPRPAYDVTLEYRGGCCDNKKKCDAPLVDKLSFRFTPPFSGPIVGANGGIEVTDVTVASGVLKVTFCLNAVGGTSPNGWFEGKQSISVLATGVGNKWSDEKHACSCLTCSSAQVGKGWPACAAGVRGCTPPFTVVTTMVAKCDDTPPPPPRDCGCTLTLGWWKTHNKYARLASQHIPWPGACNEDTKLCGRSWLSILETSPRGSTWLVLAHQWIAATLNKCRGACVPGDVDQALSMGRILLEQNCGGICYGEKRTLALQLADLLDGYNNGLMGVPHCGSNNKAPPPEECPDPKKTPPPPTKKTCLRGSGN